MPHSTTPVFPPVAVRARPRVQTPQSASAMTYLLMWLHAAALQRKLLSQLWRLLGEFVSCVY